MAMQTQMVNFVIPNKILYQVDLLAKKDFRTRSELFREAIRRYLAEEKSRKADFMQIKKAAARVNMDENEAMELVDKVRDELPMNK